MKTAVLSPRKQARPERECLDFARMLLERRGVRDGATAQQLAGDAADAGRELGMDALVAAAASLG